MADKVLVLMADIFPTGYFAASNVLKSLSQDERDSSVTVVVGCGPVGLCALVALRHFVKAKGKVFAIDSVPERLAQAKRLGATPLNLNDGAMKQTILDATQGRGADQVLEIVGHTDALQLAYELVRPWGRISSVGVHNGPVGFSGNQAYAKNLRIQFGRCPVRAIFSEALEILRQNADDLEMMIDTVMPLEDVKKGYTLFDERRVQKVVFSLS